MESTERKVISLEYENDYIQRYDEVVDFLNVSFPEWTTHSGVGSMSSELISACLKANETIYEDEDLTKKEQLKMIYSRIIQLYKHYREEYKLIFAQHCADSFFEEHEDYYNSKRKGDVKRKYQMHVNSLRYKKVMYY